MAKLKTPFKQQIIEGSFYLFIYFFLAMKHRSKNLKCLRSFSHIKS